MNGGWLSSMETTPWEEMVGAAKEGMSYLASPITDRHNMARPHSRWVRDAVRVTDMFKNRGCPVFTPAAYSYRMHREPPQGWYEWDLNFLRCSKRVIFLDMPPATEASHGCRLEHEAALHVGIPVYRLMLAEVPA